MCPKNCQYLSFPKDSYQCKGCIYRHVKIYPMPTPSQTSENGEIGKLSGGVAELVETPI